MKRTVLPLLLLCCCMGRVVADDLPKGVADTQNPRDVSLTPQESLKRITAPDGFHVTLFAGEPDVRRPIAFDFDDRGRLWVVENYSHPEWKADGASDRILIFEDTDRDGRFDRRKIFWDKGRYLTAIAWGHGGVWIGNTPELSFIPDRDRDGVPDSEPIPILDGFQRSSNNVLNNFHWGHDGWLYGAIGLSSVSLVGEPNSAPEKRTRITRGIWRFHPIRRAFEVVAEGMVNPWGADFNEYGDLITTNTVIAHLWHIVPGMYCQRRGDEQDFPFAYGRIQSITDHLHWGGGGWQSSRKNEDRHSVAGGGHAHCGGMVYLGDNWPQRYRGEFFTANLHGNRLNRDKLVPNRSTYVGVHGDDFLFGNDPWFRGLSVKYGPNGGVYLTDWHDLGECHDKDGSHRSSGRIYRIVFGQPKKRAVDLQNLTDVKLAELHLHPNEWFVRRARRILHERSAAGRGLEDAAERLRTILKTGRDEIIKLRAMWSLFVIGKLRGDLHGLLRHESAHVRRWAIRFAVDNPATPPNDETLARMASLASNDPSAKVRLALAVALQRLSVKRRWPIARGLASHAKDALDPYLPLMTWYGSEALIADDEAAALRLAMDSKIPLLRRHIARRILDVESPPVGRVVDAARRSSDEHVRFDLLQGALDALAERGSQPSPESWEVVYRQIQTSAAPEVRSVAVRLATIFGDRDALGELRKRALDEKAPIDRRRGSLQALLKLPDAASVSLLHELAVKVKPSALRRDAIQALALRNKPATAGVLLNAYSRLDASARQDAIAVLVTRREFADKLLTNLEEGAINRSEVSAFSLQQLRSFSAPSIRERVRSIWGDNDGQLKKSDEIARLKRKMTPSFLKSGNAAAGRLTFERTCAKCHTLFGEGGSVGPDLTGSGRKKLDYLLSNLIDPSAIVDPAYRLTTVVTNDGRILNGFMIQHTEKFVLLRTQDARVRLAMKEIDELATSGRSMMPEGMIRGLSDERLRDLFVYLASPTQVALPAASGEQ